MQIPHRYLILPGVKMLVPAAVAAQLAYGSDLALSSRYDWGGITCHWRVVAWDDGLEVRADRPLGASGYRWLVSMAAPESGRYRVALAARGDTTPAGPPVSSVVECSGSSDRIDSPPHRPRVRAAERPTMTPGPSGPQADEAYRL